MAFPEDPLELHLEMFLLGEWVEMTPYFTIADDFYTDVYTDVYGGRKVTHVNRFFDQEITHSHGRSDERSAVSPQTLGFRLDNKDGALTPKFQDSPYYPDVKRGCPVRLRYADNPSAICVGQVSEIHPVWPMDGAIQNDGKEDAWADFTVSGILRQLAQRSKPLRSSMYRAVTAPSNLPHIFDYWPMEDGTDAKGCTSGLLGTSHQLVGSLPLMSTINFQHATDDTLLGSQPLPVAQSGQDAAWNVKTSPATVTAADGNWVVEWNTRIPLPPAADGEVIRFDINTVGSNWVKWTVTIAWDGTEPFWRIRSYLADGSVFLDMTLLKPTHMFGDFWVTHRLGAKDVGGGNFEWSYHWSPVSEGVDPIEGGGGPNPGTAGAPDFMRVEIAKAPQGGVGWGHVIVHDGIPGGWLVGPDVGWVGERAADRFARLCDEEGIERYLLHGPPGSGLAAGDNATRKMGPQKALPLVELLQQCADTEGGILAETRSRYALILRCRGSLYNQTPHLILDAANSDIAAPFTPVDDDQQVRNDVTAQRIESGQARLFDQAHIDANGVYDEQFSVSVWRERDIKHYAGWRLHEGTWDGLRYPQLTIDFALRPDLIDTWLSDIRVGDRIQVVNLPSQHPSWPTVDLLVQGWSQTISPHGWTVTINCTPAGPWTVAVWGQSRWSPKSSTLTAAVTDVDTGLSVATSKLWTTDETPFFVMLGTELVEVTAVAGGSSPQTWTVTRDVNGLGRAHTSGTSVTLVDDDTFVPPVLAL